MRLICLTRRASIICRILPPPSSSHKISSLDDRLMFLPPFCGHCFFPAHAFFSGPTRWGTCFSIRKWTETVPPSSIPASKQLQSEQSCLTRPQSNLDWRRASPRGHNPTKQISPFLFFYPSPPFRNTAVAPHEISSRLCSCAPVAAVKMAISSEL